MIISSLVAFEFPLERIFSSFFLYMIELELMFKFLIVSSALTLPFAVRTFKILSYSNSSAVMIIPLSVLIVPFL